MADDLPVTEMPLADAHDALSDQVTQFHNYMLRRGVKTLAPREWVNEFRSWLDAYEFERQYAETLASIRKAE